MVDPHFPAPPLSPQTLLSLDDAVNNAVECAAPSVYDAKAADRLPASQLKSLLFTRKSIRTRIKLEKKRRRVSVTKEPARKPPKFIFDNGDMSMAASSIKNQSVRSGGALMSIIRVPTFNDNKSFGSSRGSKGSRKYFGLSKDLHEAASVGSRGSESSYRKRFQDPPAAILPHGLQFGTPIIMNQSRALQETTRQEIQRGLPPVGEREKYSFTQKPRDLDDYVNRIGDTRFIGDEENATGALLYRNTDSNDHDMQGLQDDSNDSRNSFVEWYINMERYAKRKQYAAVVLATFLLVAMVTMVATFTGGSQATTSSTDLTSPSVTRSFPPRPVPPSPPNFNMNNLPIRPPSGEIWDENSLKEMLEAFSHSDQLEATFSPQGKAYKWLLDSRLENMDGARVRQRYILAVFYFSLQERGWTSESGWISSDHECTWYGIKCGSDGSSSFPIQGESRGLEDDNSFAEVITFINLSNNNLHGKIPEELKYLSSLAQLVLSGNYLNGSIPSNFLSKLSQLHTLYLDENFLTGRIPDELSHLGFLHNLDVSGNSLNGSIPPTMKFAVALDDIRMTNNELQGEIPDVFSQLTSLRVFLAGNNEIEGSIPLSLSKLTYLVALQIFENKLNGSIPDFVSNKLEQLHLDNNALTGSLPDLEALAKGSLKEIRFDGNELVGNIPTEWGHHTNLEVMWLNGNKLTGTIPQGLGQLGKMVSLHLDRNMFKGVIPDSVCTLKSIHTLLSLRATCNGSNPELECACCDSC